jgi:Arc/MetJ-type ribon-helix-helix transcriptional regulator
MAYKRSIIFPMAPTDTEKVSMNMNVVDLGHIDLLVDQGFYTGRTDFLRTAIRNLLTTHSDTLKQAVAREYMVVGVLSFGRKALERTLAKGEKLDLRVVGVLTLGNDVTPELARQAIRSVKVQGAFRASQDVKDALNDVTE